jgi:hypothetical protein
LLSFLLPRDAGWKVVSARVTTLNSTLTHMQHPERPGTPLDWLASPSEPALHQTAGPLVRSCNCFLAIAHLWLRKCPGQKGETPTTPPVESSPSLLHVPCMSLVSKLRRENSEGPPSQLSSLTKSQATRMHIRFRLTANSITVTFRHSPLSIRCASTHARETYHHACTSAEVAQHEAKSRGSLFQLFAFPAFDSPIHAVEAMIVSGELVMSV